MEHHQHRDRKQEGRKEVKKYVVDYNHRAGSGQRRRVVPKSRHDEDDGYQGLGEREVSPRSAAGLENRSNNDLHRGMNPPAPNNIRRNPPPAPRISERPRLPIPPPPPPVISAQKRQYDRDDDGYNNYRDRRDGYDRGGYAQGPTFRYDKRPRYDRDRDHPQQRILRDRPGFNPAPPRSRSVPEEMERFQVPKPDCPLPDTIQIDSPGQSEPSDSPDVVEAPSSPDNDGVEEIEVEVQVQAIVKPASDSRNRPVTGEAPSASAAPRAKSHLVPAGTLPGFRGPVSRPEYDRTKTSSSQKPAATVERRSSGEDRRTDKRRVDSETRRSGPEERPTTSGTQKGNRESSDRGKSPIRNKVVENPAPGPSDKRKDNENKRDNDSGSRNAPANRHSDSNGRRTSLERRSSTDSHKSSTSSEHRRSEEDAANRSKDSNKPASERRATSTNPISVGLSSAVENSGSKVQALKSSKNQEGSADDSSLTKEKGIIMEKISGKPEIMKKMAGTLLSNLKKKSIIPDNSSEKSDSNTPAQAESPSKNSSNKSDTSSISAKAVEGQKQNSDSTEKAKSTPQAQTAVVTPSTQLSKTSSNPRADDSSSRPATATKAVAPTPAAGNRETQPQQVNPSKSIKTGGQHSSSSSSASVADETPQIRPVALSHITRSIPPDPTKVPVAASSSRPNPKEAASGNSRALSVSAKPRKSTDENLARQVELARAQYASKQPAFASKDELLNVLLGTDLAEESSDSPTAVTAPSTHNGGDTNSTAGPTTTPPSVSGEGVASEATTNADCSFLSRVQVGLTSPSIVPVPISSDSEIPIPGLDTYPDKPTSPVNPESVESSDTQLPSPGIPNANTVSTAPTASSANQPEKSLTSSHSSETSATSESQAMREVVSPLENSAAKKSRIEPGSTETANTDCAKSTDGSPVEDLTVPELVDHQPEKITGPPPKRMKVNLSLDGTPKQKPNSLADQANQGPESRTVSVSMDETQVSAVADDGEKEEVSEVQGSTEELRPETTKAVATKEGSGQPETPTGAAVLNSETLINQKSAGSAKQAEQIESAPSTSSQSENAMKTSVIPNTTSTPKKTGLPLATTEVEEVPLSASDTPISGGNRPATELPQSFQSDAPERSHVDDNQTSSLTVQITDIVPGGSENSTTIPADDTPPEKPQSPEDSIHSITSILQAVSSAVEELPPGLPTEEPMEVDETIPGGGTAGTDAENVTAGCLEEGEILEEGELILSESPLLTPPASSEPFTGSEPTFENVPSDGEVTDKSIRTTLKDVITADKLVQEVTTPLVVDVSPSATTSAVCARVSEHSPKGAHAADATGATCSTSSALTPASTGSNDLEPKTTKCVEDYPVISIFPSLNDVEVQAEPAMEDASIQTDEDTSRIRDSTPRIREDIFAPLSPDLPDVPIDEDEKSQVGKLHLQLLTGLNAHVSSLTEKIQSAAASSIESVAEMKAILDSLLSVTAKQYMLVDEMRVKTCLVSATSPPPSVTDPLAGVTTDAISEYFETLLRIESVPRRKNSSVQSSLNFERYRLCRMLYFLCHRTSAKGGAECIAANVVRLVFGRFYKAHPGQEPPWTEEDVTRCWDLVQSFALHGELDGRIAEIEHKALGPKNFSKLVNILLHTLKQENEKDPSGILPKSAIPVLLPPVEKPPAPVAVASFSGSVAAAPTVRPHSPITPTGSPTIQGGTSDPSHGTLARLLEGHGRGAPMSTRSSGGRLNQQHLQLQLQQQQQSQQQILQQMSPELSRRMSQEVVSPGAPSPQGNLHRHAQAVPSPQNSVNFQYQEGVSPRGTMHYQPQLNTAGQNNTIQQSRQVQNIQVPTSGMQRRVYPAAHSNVQRVTAGAPSAADMSQWPVTSGHCPPAYQQSVSQAQQGHHQYNQQQQASQNPTLLHAFQQQQYEALLRQKQQRVTNQQEQCNVTVQQQQTSVVVQHQRRSQGMVVQDQQVFLQGHQQVQQQPHLGSQQTVNHTSQAPVSPLLSPEEVRALQARSVQIRMVPSPNSGIQPQASSRQLQSQRHTSQMQAQLQQIHQMPPGSRATPAHNVSTYQTGQPVSVSNHQRMQHQMMPTQQEFGSTAAVSSSVQMSTNNSLRVTVPGHPGFNVPLHNSGGDSAHQAQVQQHFQYDPAVIHGHHSGQNLQYINQVNTSGNAPQQQQNLIHSESGDTDNFIMSVLHD